MLKHIPAEDVRACILQIFPRSPLKKQPLGSSLEGSRVIEDKSRDPTRALPSCILKDPPFSDLLLSLLPVQTSSYS